MTDPAERTSSMAHSTEMAASQLARQPELRWSRRQFIILRHPDHTRILASGAADDAADRGLVGRDAIWKLHQSPVTRSVISEMVVRLCPSRVPNLEIHTSTLDVSV